MTRVGKRKHQKDENDQDSDHSEKKNESDSGKSDEENGELEAGESKAVNKKRNSRNGNVKTVENGERKSKRVSDIPSYKMIDSSDEDDNGENDAEPVEKKKKVQSKKEKAGKKMAKAKSSEAINDKEDKPEDNTKDEENDEPAEYEVEKIVDRRIVKGKNQFLVRWKGYTENDDTWEQEKDLNCNDLIQEFIATQEKVKNNDKSEKTPKKGKKTVGKKNTPKSKKAVSKSEDDMEDEEGPEETKEYEVEKICEVYFKKDKKREFLVKWKGFSTKDNTWEPEENLSCPDLIENFMEKLEKLKNTGSRELRENRSHTQRYTLSMHADKRVSRRNVNKQRVTYFDADE